MRSFPLIATMLLLGALGVSCAALHSLFYPIPALPSCASPRADASLEVPAGATEAPDGGLLAAEAGGTDAGVAPVLPEEASVDTGAALRSGAIRAAYVATGHLISEAEQFLRENRDADMVHHCLARWENYVVTISERKDHYLVHLAPRLEDCVQGGGALQGGGADYQVGKSDFRLLCRDRTE